MVKYGSENVNDYMKNGKKSLKRDLLVVTIFCQYLTQFG